MVSERLLVELWVDLRGRVPNLKKWGALCVVKKGVYVI